MPGKSEHGKRKHPHLSKKSRARHRHGTMASQPIAGDTPQPAAPVTPTPARVSVSPAVSRATQYPYITSELRSIGILAGVVLVILIVLALVLS